MQSATGKVTDEVQTALNHSIRNEGGWVTAAR